MFKDLDEEQTDSLITSLSKLRLLKYLDELGFDIGTAYIGYDSSNWEEAEEWFCNVFGMINGTKVEHWIIEEEDFPAYGMVYSDDVSIASIDITNVDINEYLTKCRKKHIPIDKLWGPLRMVCKAVNPNGYWNDYEYHDIVITTDYRLCLLTTDIFTLSNECFTISFINSFIEFIRFCELSNKASNGYKDHITHCKEKHIRLPRGKRRRERLNRERQFTES